MLEERIARELTDLHQKLTAEGRVFSNAQLDGFTATFRRRFGPEVLAGLDGETLLNTMHEHGATNESLVYWLEFKNDEEFPTRRFGSIGGGSALKFGLYKRRETGAWMTGAPSNQRELTIDEAIDIARRHRDQLLAGVELLERMPRLADDAAYARLQADMSREAPDVSGSAWGHKYFSLLFPDVLDDFHVASYQHFHLVKILQVPPEGGGRYLCAGRFIAAAHQLGLRPVQLTTLLNERDGEPHTYWRVGTTDGTRPRMWWPGMRDGGHVAVGWPDIGDLSHLAYDRASKESLRASIDEAYPNTPQAIGHVTKQLFFFVTKIAEGDLVLAADGLTTLGIGRVTGPYQHEPGSDCPHRRPVEWLSVEEWAPQREGLQTTVYQLQKHPTLVEIERHLLDPKPLPPPPPVDRRGSIPRLPGIPGRIQSVLDRKRQVILYGPPGTGKTYWARRAALDLAAHAAFGASFDQLPEADRAAVTGDARDRAGLVRMCAFHPAYGYEDFLEGYRPVTQAGRPAFERRDGLFKRLCDDARSDPDRRYFLVVDEINRGDIPRIFGELLTVLERDKRGRPILLPLSAAPFSVPDNVYLIGTMNTADRSIALLDTALRRRFGFVELLPDSRVLGAAVVRDIPLGPWLDALNRRICEHVGRDARNLQVGHAYLMEGDGPVRDLARLARIVQDDIVPLLEEYCYEDYEALERILGRQLVDRAGQRVRHELFDPARRDELVSALLAPAPDLATSTSATEAEPDAPEDEADEADADQPDAAPAP